MAEQTQEEMLAEQKKNCIFCQIIKGDVPSKKVYEDDLMIAILDINPAKKGHLLIMTKEHYPIMPLIPPETFKHMFFTASELTKAVTKGALAEYTTTFIANGGVAGQQSPHFLFHIIPRDHNDNLTKFNIPQNNKDQSEEFPSMKHNMTLMMKNHLSRENKLNYLDLDNEKKPELKKETPKVNKTQSTNPQEKEKSEKEKITVFDENKINELAAMIEQNPELKALLINNPEKLQTIIDTNPQFKQLFAGINIHDLGEQVKKSYMQQNNLSEEQVEINQPETVEVNSQDTEIEIPIQKNSSTNDEKQNEKEETQQFKKEQNDVVPRAVDMNLQELKDYINSKEKLKHYLLEDIETLKELIPEHERLRIFFEETTPKEVLTKYNSEIDRPKKDASLDDIASYFDAK